MVEFHQAVLSDAQRKVLGNLGPVLSEQGFYLAGGTAVALHLGHRESVDLDWFTQDGIRDPLQLAEALREADLPFVTSSSQRGTLHGSLSDVRLSFIETGYPLLAPVLTYEEVKSPIASLDDLAGMKLAALSHRGAKKDFLDIYAICTKHRPLSEILDLYQEKFSVEDIASVLYALSYFEDAEGQEMPRMIWPTDWEEIKTDIKAWLETLSGL